VVVRFAGLRYVFVERVGQTLRRCRSWSNLCPDAALTQSGYVRVVGRTNGVFALTA
jgi:hypothetical protein